MILVHRHPSGDPAPSEAVRRITQRLRKRWTGGGPRH
ncbi:JAB domain-containing protein [Halomonas salipaludis]